jgi:hypothetical protein
MRSTEHLSIIVDPYKDYVWWHVIDLREIGEEYGIKEELAIFVHSDRMLEVYNRFEPSGWNRISEAVIPVLTANVLIQNDYRVILDVVHLITD